MLASDYVRELFARMPRGRIWPQQPGEAPTWDSLATVIGRFFAAADARAVDLIEQALPTHTTDLLDEWERTVGLPDAFTIDDPTDEQRRAAILARLRAAGVNNLFALRDFYAELFAIPGIILRHNRFPPFAAGLSGAGDGIGSGQWVATWVMEYMTNMIGSPNNFEAWGSTAVITNGYAQSPVSGEADAAQVTLDPDETLAYSAAGDPGEYHFSLWARMESGSGQLGIAVDSEEQVWDLTTTWAKLEFRGSSDPMVGVLLRNAGPEAGSFLLAWAHLGRHDAFIESLAPRFRPLNTTVLFGVIGEYQLIGTDPHDLQNYIIDDGEILIDDIDGLLLIEDP